MKVLSQFQLASTFARTALFSSTVLLLASTSAFAQVRQSAPAQSGSPMRAIEPSATDFANPANGPSNDLNCNENDGLGSKPWTCKCGTDGECIFLTIVGCEHVLEEYYVCDEDHSD